MGLIKQTLNGVTNQPKGIFSGGVNAIKSVLDDKFKVVIRCESMENNILMQRKTTETGRIPKDSAILVEPGQMAVIIDSGKVVDAVAEEGVYIFDESSTPCFAAGEFKKPLKEMWTRFTFGGDAFKSQSIYFFNIKEIMDNGFGTKGPVLFKDWGHPVINPRIPEGLMAMSVQITCFGKYTFKITDPALFMVEICGTANIFEKMQITNQLQSEVIGSVQEILNKLGTDDYKIPVLELPAASSVIKKLLEEETFSTSFIKRGLELTNIAIENVKLDEISQKKIDQYEIGGDQFTQKGVMTQSYGEALVGAANNENGATSGMMGVGFMNMGNTMFNANLQQTPQETPQVQQQNQITASVACSCGTSISGKFCTNCGKEAPQQTTCLNCGVQVIGKFCPNCGTKV